MGTSPSPDYRPPRPDMGGIPELIVLSLVVIGVASLGDWLGWWAWW
ncbi:hypothetical protein SEA_YAGO84_65 [Gordonia phage Yago84]|nr:hypothetical protein SEA_YAGO84_65 [Gordonia phage Yago84]